MEHQLYISYCGVGIPSSSQWHLNQQVEMQRLYYILGGSGGYYDQSGHLQSFDKGQIYLFPYNLYQQFVSDAQNPVRHLYFDFLSTPPVIAPATIKIDVSRNPELKSALELAIQILSVRPKSSLPESPLCTNLLQLLLSLIQERHPLPFHTDSVVCQCLETIQNNFSQPLTVSQLAADAGFEQNYFIRRFRNIMQQTPYAYLRNYRLIQARKLLQAGLSMSEVAVKVGFECPASLGRALRQTSRKM